MKKILIFSAFILLTSCARSPLKDNNNSMRRVDELPQISDDLSYKKLRKSIKKMITFFDKNKLSRKNMQFGPESITVGEYSLALQALLDSTKDKGFDIFKAVVANDFEFYEVYGDKNWGDVFVTSYFEPVIKGSKKKTKKYSQALYELPKDMVFVDLNQFFSVLPQMKDFKDAVDKDKHKSLVMRGRVVVSEPLNRIVPYWGRQQIDGEHLLLKSKQSTVLAWVDPIDAFFLHIQGSGTVRFSKKKQIRVGYAGQNGHPYTPIGKYLFDVIPREEMTAQKIEGHLRSLTRKQAETILYNNPSYVFFRKLKGKAITYMGSEVINGRTIATDKYIFPKGALCFMQFEKPKFANLKDEVPSEWAASSRFVIDQDTGGAIRGPGRVDLFYGRGKRAKQTAGVMKNRGRLYYLFPKSIKKQGKE